MGQTLYFDTWSRKLLIVYSCFWSFCFSACTQTRQEPLPDDVYHYALSRKDDLQLGMYFTAHAVHRLLSTEAGRREAVSLMRGNGITKAYIEVYRSGLVVDTALLQEVIGFLQRSNFSVAGGIATVPGNDFGVHQEGPLGWFNWQNKKTQDDLRNVMEKVAPLFDTFIVDDFLCTSDTSQESKTARDNRSWSEYRRDLLSALSESVFIAPAKQQHPNINMIIKYPQWYDRFHLFGYDVVRKTAKFDQVWVGTETRGQYSQRFGFVQPYEGFVNYRWIASLAGDKIAGAWFDHGDCDELDFIEQAYQTVLAGAQEIILFSYDAFIDGHKGHHLLRTDFPKLADLAQVVARHPVEGVTAYKPPHSDAGGDLYIMDYIGMLGVPLIPVSTYPAEAAVIFLPTQAATDTSIYQKVQQSLTQGARIIMTTGFLSKVVQGDALADLAGLSAPVTVSPRKANTVLVDEEAVSLPLPLDMEAVVAATTATVLLEAQRGEQKIPFLSHHQEQDIFVLNTHTFSQQDFDAVGEVLLSPRQLGLLEVPRAWANAIREAFNKNVPAQLDAPVRVAFQPLGEDSYVIHNYNQDPVSVELTVEGTAQLEDVFTGELIDKNDRAFRIDMPPRSRMWLQPH